jgi:hypothetical protein
MQVDGVDEPMSWKNKTARDMPKDQPIQLRFYLDNVRLYSYRIA